MTLGQVTKRVEFWQKKLSTLGVGHWYIEVDIVDEPHGRPNASAGVWRSSSYDTAKFEFRASDVPKVLNRTFDETIVHEWIHVAFRDLDEAIGCISSELALTTNQQWEDRVHHEEEGVVDRLAWLIVNLWYSDGNEELH